MRALTPSSSSKLMLGGLAAAALFLAAAPAAFAHDTSRDRIIDQRQAQQRAAIDQGRLNGSITRREYRELTAEQQRIADLERRAKADGRISRHEFREITAAQNEAGRHIRDDASNGKMNFFRRWLYTHR